MSMDEIREEKLADFFTTDLVDLSDKMEKTDQKMQFFIQLYITIIAASITLLAKELILSGQYELCSLFWLALGVMGYYVLRYSVAAMRIHYDYVNRLNHIRFTILEHLGKDHQFIEAYGYTKPNMHRTKSGMTYWLIYFVETCIAAFLSAAAFFGMYAVNPINADIAFLISVIVFCVVLYGIKRMVNKTTKELTEKGEMLVETYLKKTGRTGE